MMFYFNSWILEINFKFISEFDFWLLPGLKFWFRKDFFLETCVYTPAFGVEVHWLIFHFSFLIQKGYE